MFSFVGDMLCISMVLSNWSMMLLKFVCDVTKFVHGFTHVFDVTTISQDYLCIWQSSIINIKTANRLQPRRAVLLIETAVSYILQYKLLVKGFNCNTIKTS